MPSLNDLRKLQRALMWVRRQVLVRLWGMDIDPTATISLSARLDLTNPKGVHIGAESYVAFDAVVLTHDMTRRLKRDTRIGACCFIGGRSILMPGVTIGDHSIVGTGAVVTKDVPPHSIVAGNPAVVVRSGIETLSYGRLKERVEESLEKEGRVAPTSPAPLGSGHG